MADSNKASVDYALGTNDATTRPSARRFRPRLWPTLAVIVLVSLFIAAGQWQWNKATIKAELQKQLDALGAEPAIRIPATRVDAQLLQYRKVVVRGRYEPQYQILIDNRTYNERAGYHVITPLRVEGSDIRLLINRGWVPAPADHSQVPQVATPTGPVEISGMASIPPTRFFTLAAASVKTEWSSVWQNLDLDRYAQAVGFPIQPVVIQLDAQSDAGGFVREWIRPDNRRQTNIGYAFQWWSFAATTVVLWLVLNFRRKS